MARKRQEALGPELVELVERADVHGQRLDAQVHAARVGDGDRVVLQRAGHVLGHDLLEVLLVLKVVALGC